MSYQKQLDLHKKMVEQWEDPKWIKIRKKNPNFKKSEFEPEFIEEKVRNPKYQPTQQGPAELALFGTRFSSSGHI